MSVCATSLDPALLEERLDRYHDYTDRSRGSTTEDRMEPTPRGRSTLVQSKAEERGQGERDCGSVCSVQHHHAGSCQHKEHCRNDNRKENRQIVFNDHPPTDRSKSSSLDGRPTLERHRRKGDGEERVPVITLRARDSLSDGASQRGERRPSRESRRSPHMCAGRSLGVQASMSGGVSFLVIWRRSARSSSSRLPVVGTTTTDRICSIT